MIDVCSKGDVLLLIVYCCNQFAFGLWFPDLCTLTYFVYALHFPQNFCTPHNSVTLWDILMKLNGNLYQVMTMCRVQLRLLSLSLFQSYGTLIVFFMLILSSFDRCVPVNNDEN